MREFRRKTCEGLRTILHDQGVGQGTGLGLSQVYGFAKQSGGTATVETELGRGTSITPLFAAQPVADRHLADGVANVPAGGSETILVVEDDPEVAEVSRTCSEARLSNAVGDGRAHALEVLASDPAIDLVFSDIMMPGGMSGVELPARYGSATRSSVHSLRPVIRGGAQEAVRAGLPLIRKPYHLEELGRRIRASLVRRSAARPADAAAIS